MNRVQYLRAADSYSTPHVCSEWSGELHVLYTLKGLCFLSLHCQSAVECEELKQCKVHLHSPSTVGEKVQQ